MKDKKIKAKKEVLSSHEGARKGKLYEVPGRFKKGRMSKAFEVALDAVEAMDKKKTH